MAGTTDYTFRGISQTSQGAAVQGSFGWSKDFTVGKQKVGAYASAWGSNLNFKDGDQADLEIDYSGGLTTTVSGLKLDAFAVGYTYPDARSSLNYDYVEAAFGADYDFGIVDVGGQFYWSPDFFGGIGDAYYVSGVVNVPLPFKLTASASRRLQHLHQGLGHRLRGLVALADAEYSRLRSEYRLCRYQSEHERIAATPITVMLAACLRSLNRSNATLPQGRTRFGGFPPRQYYVIAASMVRPPRPCARWSLHIASVPAP